MVVHKNAADNHIRFSISRGDSPSCENNEIRNLKLAARNIFAPMFVSGKNQLDHSMEVIVNNALYSS